MSRNALFIEGRTDGYAPNQCYETVSVGHLIDILMNYDSEMPIYLRNDNGYTYGSIDEGSFDILNLDAENGD